MSGSVAQFALAERRVVVVVLSEPLSNFILEFLFVVIFACFYITRRLPKAQAIFLTFLPFLV